MYSRRNRRPWNGEDLVLCALAALLVALEVALAVAVMTMDVRDKRTGKVIFAPNPKQAEFLSRSEEIVGYGGAAGGGKTAALVWQPGYVFESEIQRWKRGEITQSDAWALYLRRITKNLTQQIEYSKKHFPRAYGCSVKDFVESDGTWYFPFGGKFQFGHMEKASDYLDYYGNAYTNLLYDELTEFEEEQFDQLHTRLRAADDALKPFLALRWGSNPVGKGLGWVRRRFIECAPPGQVVRFRIPLDAGGFKDIDQLFIQAFLRDNPALAADGGYEARLKMKHPRIWKALLRGDWYHVAGAFLEDVWDPELHVVEDHPVPRGAFRFRSGDYGYRVHSSITWWYVDFDGAMTAYEHFYRKGLSALQLAGAIKEIERQNGDWDEDENCSLLNGPLDTSCFNKGTGHSGPSLAEDMIGQGVWWRPADKDRKLGAGQVVKRLGEIISIRDQGRVVAKKPMARWMKRCKAPIELLPGMMPDPNDPEDVHQVNDDVWDDTRYAFMSRPLTPVAEKRDRDDEDDFDELGVYRRLRSARRGLAQGRW